MAPADLSFPCQVLRLPASEQQSSLWTLRASWSCWLNCPGPTVHPAPRILMAQSIPAVHQEERSPPVTALLGETHLWLSANWSWLLSWGQQGRPGWLEASSSGKLPARHLQSPSCHILPPGHLAALQLPDQTQPRWPRAPAPASGVFWK